MSLAEFYIGKRNLEKDDQVITDQSEIDNFIQDFSTWLKIAKTVRKDPVLGKAFISEYFKWIHDKNHDPILGLITPEKLEKVRRQRK
mgnify:CR=1 FL=1